MMSAPVPILRIPGATELDRLVERSRLIGGDPSLVVHGGGNTSTKTRERDHLGRERDVLRIKGSGTDLKSIGPDGFPGLFLDDLLPLRDRQAMSDEEMVGVPSPLYGRAGITAPIDRNIASCVPACAARRSRPRRRHMRSDEQRGASSTCPGRARRRRRGCAVHATGIRPFAAGRRARRCSCRRPC